MVDQDRAASGVLAIILASGVLGFALGMAFHGNPLRPVTCPSDVDEDELKRGIEVELEHTDDRAVAKTIACGHLVEDRRYYTHMARWHKD